MAGLFASSNSTSNYTPLPKGVYPARLIGVVDLGTQVEEFQGEEKTAHKVRLSFETPTKKKVFNEEKGEQPYVVSKEFTLSLHERASLRPVVEALLGRELTKEEEQKGLDITDLLGEACLINVLNKESSNGKTYAKIQDVTPLPDGMNCPQPEGEFQKFIVSEWDEQAFLAMPQWLQDKILEGEDSEKYRKQAANKGFGEVEQDLE